MSWYVPHCRIRALRLRYRVLSDLGSLALGFTGIAVSTIYCGPFVTTPACTTQQESGTQQREYKQVRLVPHEQGIQMFGVLSGNLPKMLGFRTGDILHEINGTPASLRTFITNFNKQVKSSSRFEFTIIRNNEEMTTYVEII